ncbi:MAG: hypothetical protein NT085_00535 [candidate division SR1 bacterium]|nr:hypothetical protein [candidate division SR1 bacterium]
MKTKIIVASSLGLLGITSMIVGATTFAANTGTDKTLAYGSGIKMMGNRGGMMKLFTNTGDAQAFKTAVENAITNKDFAAFTAVHVKYGITMNITQDQFNEMIAVKTQMDALHQKISAALKAGDYAAWKQLNKDTPILTKIDTEAKFKKLAELETYREKIDVISTDLGIGELKGDDEHGDKLGMWFDMGKGMEKGLGMKKGTGVHRGFGAYTGKAN